MIYLLLTVLLLVLEHIYVHSSRRFHHAMQAPCERSSHSEPTPSGGGFIVYLAAMTAFVMAGTASIEAACGLTLMAVVSFCDDLHPLSVVVRLLAQAAGTWLILMDIAPMPWYLLLPVLLIAVAYINAYNFMDGINGITVLYTLVTLGSLTALDMRLDFIDTPIIYCTAIATGVLGLYNCRRRALCFSGDIGAITLGAVTMYIIGRLIVSTGSIWWIVLVAVYGVDTLLTIVRRAVDGERLWQAHRRHLYQQLSNECGLPHLATAMIYAALQAIIDVVALLLPDALLAPYAISIIAILSVAYLIATSRINVRDRN